MNLHAIFAIARKDITDAIKNQLILVFLIMPVGIALLFKLFFPSLSSSPVLTIIAYDPGHSRFLTELKKTPNINIIAVASENQLETSMKDNKAIGGLVIPPGFDAALNGNAQPELMLYQNTSQSDYNRKFFQSLINLKILSITAPPIKPVWVNVGGSQDALSRGANTVMNADFILILLLLLSVVCAGMMIVPLLLVEEKQKKTLSFLLLSPASKIDILVSKSLVGLLYTLTITGVVIGLNHGWTGNWALTVLALFMGSIFMVMVGLIFGSIFQNALQLNTWGILPLLLFLFPSWVSFSQNPLLNSVGHIIPTYYLVEALNQSIAGTVVPLKMLLDMTVLLFSTVAAALVFYWIFRTRE